MIFLVGFLVFIGILVYIVVSERREQTKRMESGEDKKKIWEIVRKVVPESDDCTIVYATYTKYETNGYAKGYTMYYWYYAVGFTSERIYCVPLKFVDKDIFYEGYFSVDKSMVTRMKNLLCTDNISCTTELFDNTGDVICHLEVEGKHYSENISVKQETESAAFRALMIQWAREINGNCID